MPRRAGTTGAKPTGLVGHWKFDELGTVAIDASGTGNHAVMIGGTRVNGKVGGGINLNGSSDYINCKSDTSLDVVDSAFTWIGWFKVSELPSVSGEDKNILSKGDNRIEIESSTAGRIDEISFRLIGTPANIRLDGDVVVSTTTYIHVAGTYDGTTAILYVNGAEKDSDTISSTSVSANPFLIGSNQEIANFFKGIIDEVKFFNVALSDTEILKIYNNES